MVPRLETVDPIRVVFDHRIFAVQTHGGISRYFAGIAPLLGGHGFAPRLVAPLHHNEYLAKLPGGLIWGRRIPEFRGSRRLALAVDGAMARALAKLAKAQIVHETYFGDTRHAPSSAAIVLTVYDMIHELFGEASGSAAARVDKSAAIARADRILCISHSTLNDLLRFYPEAEPRASVTHLGFDAAIFSGAATATPQGRPYLLHVGQRGVYKNFAGLLGGYAASPRLQADFDLVCAGGPPFDRAELSAIAGLGLQGRVHRRAADDATLSQLYAGAALFVYPSLYEGFGIPPLEAMAASCPVVAVNASSVPEVCGDAAHYAADGSPEALRTAIEEVVYSSDRQARLRAEGARRLALFTWERTAAATARCYRELV